MVLYNPCNYAVIALDMVYRHGYPLYNYTAEQP